LSHSYLYLLLSFLNAKRLQWWTWPPKRKLSLLIFLYGQRYRKCCVRSLLHFVSMTTTWERHRDELANTALVRHTAVLY
jgi:hypothetical protein